MHDQLEGVCSFRLLNIIDDFNRTVRYEWLSQHHWTHLDEVRLFVTQWMWMYNHERPNMALGGITPSSGWPWPHSSTSQSGGLWGITMVRAGGRSHASASEKLDARGGRL